MVNYLLTNNANVNQRCCGKFFAPHDQKNERKDSFTSEYPSVCTKTNYEGWCYYGEYPLSFAAVLNQEDCVHMLMSKGADINKQDSNGNTVIHMLVITENLVKKQIHSKMLYSNLNVKIFKAMFNILMRYNPRLDTRNRQMLTPLTLAAKLGRDRV